MILIYLGHSSSEPCRVGCSKVPLKAYLAENNFNQIKIMNKFAPTYLCSVSQKLNSLVSDLLNCNSSNLRSSEYHLQVSFGPSGEAIIIGLLWPTFVKQFNLLAFGSFDKTETKLIKQKLVEDIDKAVATSTDVRILKSQFGLPNEDLNNLLEVIRNNQVLLGEGSNNLLEDPFLPSLMTLVQEVPDSDENYQSSRSLLRLVRQYMSALTVEERDALTTEEFLEQFWEEEIEEAELIDVGIWKIVTPTQDLYFGAEDKFNEMAKQFHDSPMAALYHYALSCEISSQDCQIILKRLKIKDCYTLPYNIMMMKAFKSQIIVTPVHGSFGWRLQNMIQNSANGDDIVQPTQEVPYHSEISLIEAISQSDKKKHVKSSRSCEFISSGPERLIPVKRVGEWTDTCYTIDGNDFTYFEEQRNMISRYFSRQNGNLVLAEFATIYQYPGEDKAVKLFNLYHGKINDIPMESTSSVTNEPLPDFIITGHEDVMVKRKKAKILKVKDFDKGSYEDKFSRVLLYYYPLNSLDDMTEQSVERLYDERCDENQELSKIEKNYVQFIKQYRDKE